MSFSVTKDEFVIVIRSDGAGVRPNFATVPVENSFTAEIEPALFDDNQDYLVGLHSIEYDSTASEALKIECNIVEPTRQGRDKTRTLYRIARTEAVGGDVKIQERGTIPLWLQMTHFRQVREIRIDLQNDTTGAVSTNARSVPTIITLVIKRREFT